MKLYNREQLKKVSPNNTALFKKENRFFYVDSGIVPFTNKYDLRCYIMTRQAFKSLLKGELK